MIKGFWTACLLLALSACAQQGGQIAKQKALETCYSADCLLAAARADVASACNTDLLRYPAQDRDRIKAQYQYPFTNYDTYFRMRKAGFSGPSPRDWCQRYAQKLVQTRYVSSERVASK